MNRGVEYLALGGFGVYVRGLFSKDAVAFANFKMEAFSCHWPIHRILSHESVSSLDMNSKDLGKELPLVSNKMMGDALPLVELIGTRTVKQFAHRFHDKIKI